MLLVGAFFALLTVGFWVRCARRPRRLARRTGPAADAAFRRHPAGRALGLDAERAPAQRPDASYARVRPSGPDDDPEFLSELDRLIRRRQSGNDA
jgi:hypothetical protein